MLHSHEPMFILVVYFPSSNHTIDDICETLGLLWALYEYCCDKGVTLTLRDFNGALRRRQDFV